MQIFIYVNYLQFKLLMKFVKIYKIVIEKPSAEETEKLQIQSYLKS